MKCVGKVSLIGLILAVCIACGGEAAPEPTKTPASAVPPVSQAPKSSVAVPSGPGDSDVGKGLILSKGCVACHAIEGVPGAVGTIGPNLTGLASRPTIVEGALAFSEENLAKWLQDPQAVKPETLMVVPVPLSDQDIRDLVSYLVTLK